MVSSDIVVTPGGMENTDKTPILIATATPHFSFLFICKLVRKNHGSIARQKSIKEEYAAAMRQFQKVLLRKSRVVPHT